MKDETAGFAINKFVGLKPKKYSFLVGDSTEHKKATKIKCCWNNMSEWIQRCFGE